MTDTAATNGIYQRTTETPGIDQLAAALHQLATAEDATAVRTAREAIAAALPPWTWASTPAGGAGLGPARIAELAAAIRRGPDDPAAQTALEQVQALLHSQASQLDITSIHAPHPPPLSWLVRNWMPDATLSVLTGAGGAGKSRIALQLAVAIATGAEQFIHPSPTRRPLSTSTPAVLASGPVVFAAWETRQLAFANRLAGICGPNAERADTIAQLNNQLHYVNMRPSGGLWGARPGMHTSTAGAWLAGGEALLSKAAELQTRLLIIDPLAAAFVANENDRALVRAFLSALDQWAEDNGCAVLIISHPPKSGDAQSGSTDWRNGVQSVWELAADKDEPGGARKLQVDKLNEGPTPAPVTVDYEGGRFVEVHEQAGSAEPGRAGQASDPSTIEGGKYAEAV